MNIIEKHTYRSATLPGAPARSLRAHAEADDARGIEVAMFLSSLAGLSSSQWKRASAVPGASSDAASVAVWSAASLAAWNAMRDESRDLAWDAVRDEACDTASDAACDAALALVVRDLITLDQFNILTAGMRLAGIDFDNLAEPQ